MSEAERLQVIRTAVEAAKGTKARVIAGTGSNNTAAAIDFTRKAREAGCDQVLTRGQFNQQYVALLQAAMPA